VPKTPLESFKIDYDFDIDNNMIVLEVKDQANIIFTGNGSLWSNKENIGAIKVKAALKDAKIKMDM